MNSMILVYIWPWNTGGVCGLEIGGSDDVAVSFHGCHGRRYGAEHYIVDYPLSGRYVLGRLGLHPGCCHSRMSRMNLYPMVLHEDGFRKTVVRHLDPLSAFRLTGSTSTGTSRAAAECHDCHYPEARLSQNTESRISTYGAVNSPPFNSIEARATLVLRPTQN